MKKYLTLSLSVLGALLFAQISTPNTGKTYTINDLDQLSESISFNEASNTYFLNDDLIIATSDTFLVDKDYTLAIAQGKLITIEGKISIDAPKEVIFTSQDPGNKYFMGIRISESATATFNNFSMFYGGGIRSLTGNFLMENSEVSNQNSGTSTGGAINFSRGNPVIKNSRFTNNVTPAVASGASEAVSLTYEGNYLSNNNTENSNRPQINMGPSGANPTTINNNIILGNRANTRVGGVSVSSLVGTANNAIITNNSISDNRYGITISGGNSKGLIKGNTLLNNNSENNPALGGSGISISLSSNSPQNIIYIQDNVIRGNIWGITNIGKAAFINMGDESQPGNNIFADNQNGGQVYALYNNSVNPVSAHGNCWIENEKSTAEEVEKVIFHQVDNPALGLVDFSNFLCSNLGINDLKKEKIKVYPNPSNGQFNVETKQIETLEVYDINGRLVYQSKTKVGQSSFNTSLKKGVYILKIGKETTKLLIK